MSLKIYTYGNPYEIDREPFWDEIKNAVQFCVSQTMVNGLYHTYPAWNDRKQLATIRSLTNSMYSDWDDINIKVRQIMEVDSVINTITFAQKTDSNIRRSLLFNTKSIADAIRILCELGIDPCELNNKNINVDQKYLVEIYREIKSKKNTFEFVHVNDAALIDASVRKALKSKNKEAQINEIDFDTVVIHGIHQFSPAILCAIDDLAKWKNVILMFNYQSQYQAVYETWLNIYSLFEKKIMICSENQFVPVPLFVNSYASNVLGDYIGKLSNGDFSDYNGNLANLEVIEYENVTEFANHAARIFERAKKQSDASQNKIPPVAFMKEQMYSTSNKVNDILRAYFPDQFGERHFLDYPLGHFFVATTNLWNSELACTEVKNFSDVRECIGAGIISESKPGLLTSTFDKVIPYIEKETTLLDIVSKLKNLSKYVGSQQTDKKRIGYFNVKKSDIVELINAITELNDIICSFFTDFSSGKDNFQRFYNRIQSFITNRVNTLSDLDDEMKVVVQKLLDKLSKSDLPNTGTYTCLRQTLSFYLSQDENINRGAQWIVRGFEQIDGDILRSHNQDPEKTCYHFCCLSDKDMCADVKAKLPWPLDLNFFENAHVATEQNYRIFVKSKMEYHNFNRYALLYGLVFNRLGVKLSYIRTEDGKTNDLYCLLSMLGIKVKKYKSFENNNVSSQMTFFAETTSAVDQKIAKLSYVDKIKSEICPYRFVLESIVQENTEFRDQFLIHTYMRVLIRNQIILDKCGMAFSENALRDSIVEAYQVLCDKFKLADEIEKTKLIAAVYKDIKKYWIKNGRYRVLSEADKNDLENQKDLLLVDYHHLTSESIPDMKAFVESGKYRCNHGEHCKYCASKDVCLEHNHFQEE